MCIIPIQNTPITSQFRPHGPVDWVILVIWAPIPLHAHCVHSIPHVHAYAAQNQTLKATSPPANEKALEHRQTHSCTHHVDPHTSSSHGSRADIRAGAPPPLSPQNGNPHTSHGSARTQDGRSGGGSRPAPQPWAWARGRLLTEQGGVEWCERCSSVTKGHPEISHIFVLQPRGYSVHRIRLYMGL